MEATGKIGKKLQELGAFVLAGAKKPGAKLVAAETGRGASSHPHGPAAEMAAAGVLGLSAVYIVFNESVANWQALWFCAGLAALAVTTLAQARDAPG